VVACVVPNASEDSDACPMAQQSHAKRIEASAPLKIKLGHLTFSRWGWGEVRDKIVNLLHNGKCGVMC